MSMVPPTAKKQTFWQGLGSLLRNPQFMGGLQNFSVGLTEHTDPGFHARQGMLINQNLLDTEDQQFRQRQVMEAKQAEARRNAFVNQMLQPPNVSQALAAGGGPTPQAAAQLQAPPAFQGMNRGQTTPAGRQVYQGPGGAYSEKSITVTHPSINNGAPTNIPSVYGGKVLSEQEAVSRVAAAGGVDPETGRPLPAFGSIPQAVQAAKARSAALGQSLQPQHPAGPLQDPANQEYIRQLARVDPAAALKLVTQHRFQPPAKEPEPVYKTGQDGRLYLMNPQGGAGPRPAIPNVGAAKPDAPTTLMKNLKAFGLKPGTEEYNKAGLAKLAPSGMELTTNPDGSVSFRQGPGVGSGLSKATENKVQSRVLGAGDTLQHLASIRSRYRPEFQQLGTRWNAWKTGMKEKLGFGDTIDPADKQTLAEYSAYRADAGQLFALTLKDLSGVAVNPTEFKRAEAWLPNPGTGIFDGDSPTELKSKLERFEEFSRRAYMKYHYINKNGLTVDDIDVDDIPGIVQKRGDELFAEALARGLKDAAAKTAVKRALIEEFGSASI